MKDNTIKMNVYKVICIAVKNHGHTVAAQISIMQSLQYYEHLSEPMAELLSYLAKDFDHAQLGDEILREIAGMTFSAQDTKGPRAFSRFLVKFSEESPRSVLKQISLLLEHLDSEVRARLSKPLSLMEIHLVISNAHGPRRSHRLPHSRTFQFRRHDQRLDANAQTTQWAF